MNQSWLNESQLSLNVPYWSLCYEFWYYVLFGFIFFIKNIKYKFILVILVLAIVGPGIAVLFPIWLMGAGLAKYNIKFNISSKIWLLCTLIPILTIMAIVEFKWDTSTKNIISNEFPILYLLRNSTKLVTDNLIGLLLFIHFATLKFAPEIFNRIMIKISPVSKYLAGFSFSLYLFHDPLLRTSAIFLPNENDSKMHLFLVVSLVICICWIFSLYTEKNAPYVRRWILKKTNLQN